MDGLVIVVLRVVSLAISGWRLFALIVHHVIYCESVDEVWSSRCDVSDVLTEYIEVDVIYQLTKCVQVDVMCLYLECHQFDVKLMCVFS